MSVQQLLANLKKNVLEDDAPTASEESPDILSATVAQSYSRKEKKRTWKTWLNKSNDALPFL